MLVTPSGAWESVVICRGLALQVPLVHEHVIPPLLVSRVYCHVPDVPALVTVRDATAGGIGFGDAVLGLLQAPSCRSSVSYAQSMVPRVGRTNRVRPPTPVSYAGVPSTLVIRYSVLSGSVTEVSTVATRVNTV